MALGTPVAAAVAYSAASGTSVAPAYPAGILSTDEVVMFIGMKPTTANGGAVTTPAGWTLRDSLTAAGGYGTTTGADVGNTNLYVYTWDAPVAGTTGTLTVTVGDNNVCWAFIARIPGGGSYAYGTADGQRTTTPTSPMTVALTNGTSPATFQTGDLAIWAMCIPTDVTTPAQFSAEAVTATGATFSTAVELNEPDSTTGNDIGGYSAYATVTAGSSTTAPSVTATLAGTLTNVRGPIILLRVRDTSQALSPTKFDNTQTFFAPATTTSNTLSPSLVTNAQTFYSPTVTAPSPVQNLTPGLLTNSQSFFSPTLNSSYALTASKFDNAQTFYSTTVASNYPLSPSLLTNSQTFYSLSITQTGPVQSLAPSLETNDQTFFSPTTEYTVFPAKFENTQEFFAPTVTAFQPSQSLYPSLATNSQVFYSPTVAQITHLLPSLYTNDQTFFSPTVNQRLSLYPQSYVVYGYFAPEGYTSPNAYNTSSFFPPSIATGPVTLEPSLFVNESTFFGGNVKLVWPTLTTEQLLKLTLVWRRLGLDADNPLTESSAEASFGSITITKTGDSVVTSTRSGTDTVTGDAEAIISDLYQRFALDESNPLVVSDTQISSGTVAQSRTRVNETTVQVKRV